MDRSTIGFLCSIFGFFVIVVGWILHSIRWYRSRAEQTRIAADRGKELVVSLLQSATSPATRAEIHAYVLFECIQMEARRTRGTIYGIAMGGALGAFALLQALLHRVTDFSGYEWVEWLAWACIGSLAVIYIVALLAAQRLRKIESEWLDSAGERLFNRAITHTASIAPDRS